MTTTMGTHPGPPAGIATSNIRILPEVLINQIAAGEVVERPASILKELVENSIDAGATRVEVRLWNGGLDKIQILDNGCGMTAEDLALCLTRHATSKIQSAADLESIATFGFRGEALASIAAVSKIEIRSRKPDSSTGYSVDADFGLMTAKPKPVGCPAGTSISVEKLFDRLPARLKFMRSPGTESSHCSKVLKEIACGNPQTQFFLTNQDRKTVEYVASTRPSRFAECFRPAWEPMHVLEENEEASLEAYLTPPHQIQDRGDIWFYINARPIRNRGLLAAVRQAYLATLGPHHDPSGAVFLDIRKDWVDVNVHPQKTEVRCYRQETLFPWILSTIKKEIGKQRTMQSIGRNATPTFDAGAQASGPRLQAPVTGSGSGTDTDAGFPDSQMSDFGSRTPAPRYVAQPLLADALHGGVSERLPFWSASQSPSPKPDPVTDTRGPNPESRSSDLAPSTSWLRYLGQIKASYLVCESTTGLVLVDQHALHEKIRTEELKKRFTAGDLAVQKFLLPKILPFKAELLPVLEESAEALSKFGFEIELFGTGEAALRSRPELIAEEDCGKVLEEILVEINSQHLKPHDILNQSLHRLIATMACHSAIRANHLLSPMEAQSLLDRLDRLELGWTCPHGRPILFELSYPQIEHHFERA